MKMLRNLFTKLLILFLGDFKDLREWRKHPENYFD